MLIFIVHVCGSIVVFFFVLVCLNLFLSTGPLRQWHGLKIIVKSVPGLPCLPFRLVRITWSTFLFRIVIPDAVSNKVPSVALKLVISE